MKVYRTTHEAVLEYNGQYYKYPVQDWNSFINETNLLEKLTTWTNRNSNQVINGIDEGTLLPPIGSHQELWACGVTYLRSKIGRQEESKSSGGADFYARVYEAQRPEVFFKATPHRVVGHGQSVRIRKDSTWDVPEPELTLVVNTEGKIIGYTIGNDMSSRSIEGENPLYLPQAKTYDACAAIGPCIYLANQPISADTEIAMCIQRQGVTVFEGKIALDQMKRTPEELVSYVFREASFPYGCLIMTGTGIVPGSDFTLTSGDKISISIAGIGTLINTVS